MPKSKTMTNCSGFCFVRVASAPPGQNPNTILTVARAPLNLGDRPSRWCGFGCRSDVCKRGGREAGRRPLIGGAQQQGRRGENRRDGNLLFNQIGGSGAQMNRWLSEWWRISRGICQTWLVTSEVMLETERKNRTIQKQTRWVFCNL